MRFSNAKMVQDYNNFKLGKKGGDAQMVIEPWNSSIGAKGQLQQVLFRVSGMPVDRESLELLLRLVIYWEKHMLLMKKPDSSKSMLELKLFVGIMDNFLHLLRGIQGCSYMISFLA